MVEDDLSPVDAVIECPLFEDRAMHEVDVILDRVEVRQTPGGEVIQYPDVGTCPHEALDQVGADEPGATSHAYSSSSQSPLGHRRSI